MTTTPEVHSLAEELDPAALAAAAAAPEPTASETEAPIKRSSRKSVLALSVCALAINGSAAFYTLPADFQMPNVSALAELLPRQKVPTPKPDPVIAALKEILAAQQQHAASLQENNHLLQQNTALLQQDSTIVASLRQSITDERGDVKRASTQLSTLIAKVDTLQNTMMSDVTASIRKAHARMLSAAMRKRMVRQSKPVGPVSIGGAPLSVPATTAPPES